MNSDAPPPHSPDERFDGLERELTELKTRIASVQSLIRWLTAVLVLALSAIILALAFPEWIPKRPGSSGAAPNDSGQELQKKDIYDVKQSLDKDLSILKKELKEDIDGARRQARSDNIAIRAQVQTLQESTNKGFLDARKEMQSPGTKK
jgi:hypothetical protein